MFVSQFSRSAGPGSHGMAGALTPRRQVGARSLIGLALGLMLAAFLLAGAPRAEAAAYAVSVHQPKSLGNNHVQGGADVIRDCSGTLGCSNTISVEWQLWRSAKRLGSSTPAYGGRHTVTAFKLPGCRNYRTVVTSLNDIPGSWGGGVNVGPIGGSVNGMRVYRYRTVKYSAWTRLCRS